MFFEASEIALVQNTIDYSFLVFLCPWHEQRSRKKLPGKLSVRESEAGPFKSAGNRMSLAILLFLTTLWPESHSQSEPD